MYSELKYFQIYKDVYFLKNISLTYFFFNITRD